VLILFDAGDRVSTVVLALVEIGILDRPGLVARRRPSRKAGGFPCLPGAPVAGGRASRASNSHRRACETGLEDVDPVAARNRCVQSPGSRTRGRGLTISHRQTANSDVSQRSSVCFCDVEMIGVGLVEDSGYRGSSRLAAASIRQHTLPAARQCAERSFRGSRGSTPIPPSASTSDAPSCRHPSSRHGIVQHVRAPAPQSKPRQRPSGTWPGPHSTAHLITFASIQLVVRPVRHFIINVICRTVSATSAVRGVVMRNEIAAEDPCLSRS